MAIERYMLIAPNRLRDNSYIDKNIRETDLTTSIMIAQETMLQPVIGTALYDALIDGKKNDTLSDEYQELINGKIGDVLTYYTIYQLINTKVGMIGNSGVTKDEKSLSLEELRSIRSNIKQIYIGYERILLNYLNAHVKEFDEFDDITEGGDNSKESEQTTTFFDISTLDQY